MSCVSAASGRCAERREEEIRDESTDAGPGRARGYGSVLCLSSFGSLLLFGRCGTGARNVP